MTSPKEVIHQVPVVSAFLEGSYKLTAFFQKFTKLQTDRNQTAEELIDLGVLYNAEQGLYYECRHEIDYAIDHLFKLLTSHYIDGPSRLHPSPDSKVATVSRLDPELIDFLREKLPTEEMYKGMWFEGSPLAERVRGTPTMKLQPTNPAGGYNARKSAKESEDSKQTNNVPRDPLRSLKLEDDLNLLMETLPSQILEPNQKATIPARKGIVNAVLTALDIAESTIQENVLQRELGDLTSQGQGTAIDSSLKPAQRHFDLAVAGQYLNATLWTTLCASDNYPMAKEKFMKSPQCDD